MSDGVDDRAAPDDRKPESTPTLRQPLPVAIRGLAPEGQSFAKARVLDELRERMFGRAAAPVRLRRYALAEQIGQGGMGVVMRARDEALGREVAIKLIARTARGGAGFERMLIDEARALAMLSHPNVVEIYDAGCFGVDELADAGASWAGTSGVFVVMELVRGVTLRAWARAQPRSVAEIVEAFGQAARGVAAAHAVGLVHRDIKPTNLMMGDDGRVRVLDFGLARALGTPSSAQDTWPHGSEPQRTDAVRLAEHTAPGMVVGTLGYLAPEVAAGGRADAQSDQYSFCVGLRELLLGARPVARADTQDLERSTVDATPPRAPGTARLPGRLGRILARGLDPDPARRFPNMDALARALASFDRPRWRPWVAATACTGAVAVAAWAGASRDPTCATAELPWSHEARAAAEREVRTTGIGYADEAWSRTAAALDRRRLELDAVASQACDTTLSVDARRRMSMCLDDTAVALDVVAGSLFDVDATRLARAVAVARDIPDPQRCLALGDEADAIGDREFEHVRELGRDLGRARVLRRLGTPELARPLAAAVEAAATASGYRRLAAKATWVTAGCEEDLGRLDLAVDGYTASYYLARELGDDALAAEAATDLAYLQTVALADHPAAKTWVGHAAAALARLPTDGAIDLRVSLAVTQGALAENLGQLAVAREHYTRAMALEPTPSARVLNDLSNVESVTGNDARARELLEAALAVVERTLGAEHPDAARILSNLGNLDAQQGDLAAAERRHRRALEIGEGAWGPDHRTIPALLSNLGYTHVEMGRYAVGIAELERALEIQRATLGDHHADVAKTMTHLGWAYRVAGQHQRAVELLRSAVGRREAALGADHPDVAFTVSHLIDAELAVGQVERARQRIDQLEQLTRRSPESARFFVESLVRQRAALLAALSQPSASRQP